MPERFSNLFEIALVLLGILSAIEFEYFLQVWGPITALRWSVSPYIIILPVWFLKEITKRQLPIKYWLLFSEFCYELWIVSLSYYLRFLWLFLLPDEPWFLLGSLIFAILCCVFVAVVIYAYFFEYRTVLDYYKSFRWIILRAISLIIAIIFGVSIFGISLPPIP